MLFLYLLMILGSLIAFVKVYGEHSQNRCLQRLYILVNTKIIGMIRLTLKTLFGRNYEEKFNAMFHYVLKENNPLAQWFYFLLAGGGFSLVVIKIIPRYFPNEHISLFFPISSCAYMLFCYWLYYKTCTVSPGIITKDNWQHLILKYPYDNLIFKKNQECSTCLIPK